MKHLLVIAFLLLCSSYVSAQIRGSNITPYNNVATETLSMPSGATVGDFAVIIFVNCYSNNPVAGWTLVQASGGGYFNGGIYYTYLTAPMISSGVTVTASGSYYGEAVVVDFIGPTGGYVTSGSVQGSTAPASSTTPALSGATAQDTVLWISANRATSTNTVSRGTQLQTGNVGGNASLSVYDEVLSAGFSNSVTYTLNGTYSNGYYTGYIVVAPASYTPTSYYISPSGVDTNNGTSTGTPWLTPNHALNCGDTITAAVGTYAAANFNETFGPVTCAAGNNVAWLTCATFDGCKILANGSGALAAMAIDSSYWGVQGWEISTINSSYSTCFGVYPNGSTETHHVIFANDIANTCEAGGFITANESNLASSDYVVFIGNIAYNSAYGSGVCTSGISIFQPVKYDSLPGTHIYIAGNFSFDNVDPNPCNGGTPTDGEGITLDVLNGDDTGGLVAYNQQIVVENNISIFNGQAAIETNANTSAPTYFVGNTASDNNTSAAISSGTCGQILIAGFQGVTSLTYVSRNISYSATTEGACGFSTPYAYYAYNVDATNKVYATYAYNASGNNTGQASSTITFGPNIVSGTDPGFTHTNPGAPSCGSASSVPNCMATVIANFTPTAAAAKSYGYQVPGTTSIYDPLYPHWLCSVTNLPSGLVTPGCLTASAHSGATASGAKIQ